MTDFDGFRVERDPGRAVATITLDVPGKLNRVSMAARDQLSALFAELDAYCLASPLARFKRPREYRHVDSLPKSASGKILRRMLRDETTAGA